MHAAFFPLILASFVFARGEDDMSRDACGCGLKHGVDRRRATSMLIGANLVGAGLVVAGLGALSPAALAKATQMAPRPEDEGFMRLAIAEAAKGDFPFGAAIVRDARVLSTGRNLGKTANDPTAHAEMMAIRRFVAARPAAELEGATLYASGEPCPMCMSAILWCHIGRVVFAASIEELATRLGQIMLPSRSVAEAAPFANISITGGVLSAEALALFRRD
jgi:guanine deaminase